MADESSTINDLVTKAAEEYKEKNKENSGADSEKDKGGGSEPSDAEKEAAAKAKQEADDKVAQEEQAKLEAAEKIKSEATAELLKKFKVDSLEELEKKLAEKDKKPLSKEEQEKADEVYEASLRQFAVEKGKMKLEQFDQLTTLKSKKDADLIFEKYLEDWKEENPEVKENIHESAKEDFEKEYRLNSENEKIKAKGIQRLAKEAAELRSPLESSYNDVKEEFDAVTQYRVDFPNYVKSLEKIANELVPEKVEYYRGKDGDEELPPIEIPLSADDRKEILDKITKRLQSPDSFGIWKEGKTEDLKERVSEYAEYLVGKKTKENGNAKIAEFFLGKGMDKGSKIGAENSFATQQTKPAADTKTGKSKSDAEREVLEQFKKK